MNLGILIPATATTGDLSAIARRVEALGFESLWIPEHPVIPVGFKTPVPGGGRLPEHYNRWADPFVALTLAAAVTTRIKLATGICLLPEREPLITAKTIASLDFYSGGRVLLGVGAGWLREETEAMGTPFRVRWKRLRETVEALRVCWTHPEPHYEGELVRFPAVYCDPKPVQKGGPPIFLGAHVPKALERVAQTYDGWCPLSNDPTAYKRSVDTIRSLTRAAGRNPDALQMTALVDPKQGALSAADLGAYRDAGAHRIVLFAQPMAAEIANGKGMEWLDRIAPIVERAQGV
jgi:probable F420-dependent oxidoreductase